MEEKKLRPDAACRCAGIGRRPGPAQWPRARESSVRQGLDSPGGGRGNRNARGCVPAGGYRACNVRQERYCALFSRCRSSSVDSDRARKWEPVTLKAVVGPVMGNSLEVGNLARARALIEKNAKRAILCTRQVLTF